jgi:hypothetical protein
MLTPIERKWITKLQKVLDECPSDRMGFYTIGDSDISIYDRSVQSEIDAIIDTRDVDFGQAIEEVDAHLGSVCFPSHVHSTSG